MKPIKVEDQTILQISEELKTARHAMEHWTCEWDRRNELFWDTVRKVYPDLDNSIVYDHDTKEIIGIDEAHKREKEAIVKKIK